jgi:carboxyl-terminal processing protease
MEDGFVKVIAPIDDTPAERAGLKAGDLIIRIDDKPVKGMSLNDAVNVMRGKPGTEIGLTILREGADRPFNVELARDIIHVASVKNRTLEPGYGYVRVSHFQSRTTEDLLTALSELEEENDGKLTGLVLDLRNNPGGVLNSAVGVSDAFLGGGLIVYTKGRVDDSELQFKAGPDDVLKGAPIVVLVNEGSASASEIVAGALQDHKRAIIMGRPTFGKGSVQTIVPIDDSTALKLTTARYYTPSGRSIQAQGIEPDIELTSGEINVVEEPSVDPVKEADLRRHLNDADETDATDATNEEGAGADESEAGAASDGEVVGETKGEGEGEGEGEKRPLAVEDYQLGQALNVLKGLNILGRRTED